ncbi:16S rRNA (cytosine(1402)-N(4))-methyltransferase RsmH [Ancylothrix sp. C2]|uniref:16S rRNA (cytosine(1402)-N(4))-methyltransferase RsmH n=1 Tax=Ancylothrix sp. D3o TaxID=2953691 RepID=UPI0021BA4EB3|nr:16S rRNA (cytosine(1402)-N(4))-methyltransferase RsmH [Ancylothrix sp. D3o]MCT7950952.1 16S rRNA (cytosine(1402)-N(4))-methyltransferase RsmH [Ancylothrix sp. D3o]
MTDSPTPPAFVHIPVLAKELIEALNIHPGGHYLDATLGAGGHTSLILATSPDVRVTAIDRDEQAIATAQTYLSQFGENVKIWRGNFCEYPGQSEQFDGIIADLGVSSGQLDTPARGFSFRHTAALDMRMDNRQPLTAAEIINKWQEKQLADIFFTYGEERLSRRIARTIVSSRPFSTTTQLAEAIASCVPAKYRHGRIHPATRVFQALRIAVNAELTSLEKFIDVAPNWLKPGGKIGIISFHSLEDRIVKHRLRENEQLRVLTKKPILPQEQEQATNPRSRSAKLRIAEKSSP